MHMRSRACVDQQRISRTLPKCISWDILFADYKVLSRESQYTPDLK
jgi:hypothetical protein